MFLLRWKSADLQHGPDLDRTDFSWRHALCNAHRLVEIFRVDYVVAAKLFARLGEWTISHQSLAVSHPHARRGGNRMQRTGGNVLARRAQLPRKLGRLDVAVLTFTV